MPDPNEQPEVSRIFVDSANFLSADSGVRELKGKQFPFVVVTLELASDPGTPTQIGLAAEDALHMVGCMIDALASHGSEAALFLQGALKQATGEHDEDDEEDGPSEGQQEQAEDDDETIDVPDNDFGPDA